MAKNGAQPLKLGKVPPDVAQRWLDELNRVLEAGRGVVETEVRDRRVFVRPQASYQFDLQTCMKGK